MIAYLTCCSCLILYIAVTVLNFGVYVNLKKHAFPSNIPGLETVMFSVKTMTFTTLSLAIWTAGEAILLSICEDEIRARHYRLGASGIVELLAVVVWLVGIGYWAQVLPTAPSHCQDAEKWLVKNPAIEKSLFAFLAEKGYKYGDGTFIDALSICNTFKRTWSVNMGFVCCAFVAILTVFEKIVLKKPSERTIMVYFLSGAFYTVRTPILKLYMFGRILQNLFRKWLRRPKLQDIEDELEMLFAKTAVILESKEKGKALAETAEEARLRRLLSIDPVTLSIAQNLHYDELMNLAVTSSLIYRTLFPTCDPGRRRYIGKHSTCRNRFSNNAIKDDCIFCGIPVCTSCSRRAGPSDDLIARHKNLSHYKNCKEYCTQCYWKYIAGPSSGGRVCATMEESGGRRRAYLCYSQKVRDWKRMCMTCSKGEANNPGKRIKELQIARRFVLKDSHRSAQCFRCKKALRDRIGPRWRVCTSCNKECLNEKHLGWVWPKEYQPLNEGEV